MGVASDLLPNLELHYPFCGPELETTLNLFTHCQKYVRGRGDLVCKSVRVSEWTIYINSVSIPWSTDRVSYKSSLRPSF